MGFHLRKSINLGGVRFNISNSGLGCSLGVKGLRTGIDAKGRQYLAGGKGIVRYRKYLSQKDSINNDNIYKISDTPSSTPLRFFILIVLSLLFFIFIHALSDSLFFSIIITFPLMIILKYKLFPKKMKMNIFIGKAMEAYSNKNYKEAIELLKETEKFIPTELSNKEEIKKYLYDVIYRCYIEQEKFKEAMQYIEKGSGNEKEKVLQCYYGMQEWEKIFQYIRTNYSKFDWENSPLLLSLQGCSLLSLGESYRALAILENSPVSKKTLDMSTRDFHYILARCYEENNEKENALKAYYRLFHSFPNHKDVRERLLRLENS